MVRLATRWLHVIARIRWRDFLQVDVPLRLTSFKDRLLASPLADAFVGTCQYVGCFVGEQRVGPRQDTAEHDCG